MPSLSPKDRVPLCLFTFVDGRRCRTPRTGRHPHFCFYHAQKEARAQAAVKLGKHLAYFFSGDYLSACDLSTALSRLIPAVVRGDIKPKLARTVAYMFQTQLQAIHLSQREYVNAFGTDGWRKALRTSVSSNRNYLYPPDHDDAEPEPQQPEPPQAQRTHPLPQPQQPAQAPPSNPSQPTQAQTQPQLPASSPQTPSRPQQSPAATPQPSNAPRPSPADAEAALSVARSMFRPHPNSAPPPSAAPIANSAASEACHPERSEGPRHNPAPSTTDENLLASAPAQSAQPNNATPPTPPHPQPRPTTPTRDPYAVHFDHNYRLIVDGKPF